MNEQISDMRIKTQLDNICKIVNGNWHTLHTLS